MVSGKYDAKHAFIGAPERCWLPRRTTDNRRYKVALHFSGYRSVYRELRTRLIPGPRNTMPGRSPREHGMICGNVWILIGVDVDTAGTCGIDERDDLWHTPPVVGTCHFQVENLDLGGRILRIALRWGPLEILTTPIRLNRFLLLFALLRRRHLSVDYERNTGVTSAKRIVQSPASGKRTKLIRCVQARCSLARRAFFHKTFATNSSLVSANGASTT